MHSCLWPTWRAVFAVFSRTIYLVPNVHISNKATAGYQVMLSLMTRRLCSLQLFCRSSHKQGNNSLLLRLPIITYEFSLVIYNIENDCYTFTLHLFVSGASSTIFVLVELVSSEFNGRIPWDCRLS